MAACTLLLAPAAGVGVAEEPPVPEPRSLPLSGAIEPTTGRESMRLQEARGYLARGMRKTSPEGAPDGAPGGHPCG